MKISYTTLVAAVLALLTPQTAGAQAGGSADIELGATHASDVERNAGMRPAARMRNESDVRVGVQARLDAINLLSVGAPDIGGVDTSGIGRRLLVPMMTPGVRFLDDRLFLGLGLGLAGISTDIGTTEVSRSGFSLSPLASYGVLTDTIAALSLAAWLNFASVGETETCGANGVCLPADDDANGWGLSVAANVRGFITRGLSLGGEFGWGFLDVSADGGADSFAHSIFGNIFLEASVGL